MSRTVVRFLSCQDGKREASETEEIQFKLWLHLISCHYFHRILNDLMKCLTNWWQAFVGQLGWLFPMLHDALTKKAILIYGAFENSSIALDSPGWEGGIERRFKKRTFNTIWRWYKERCVYGFAHTKSKSGIVAMQKASQNEESPFSAGEIILFLLKICNTAGVVQWKLF